MTERVTARHRAELRPSTPLTGLTTTLSAAVGDHAAVLGRGGMVIAVSTGLVTGVGIVDAGAATRTGTDPAQTASMPLVADVASSPVLSAGVDALAAAPVTAPVRAKVSFEHSAFKALPQHGATTATLGSTSRDVATISRSLARQAFVASQPAPVRRAVATAVVAARTTTSGTVSRSSVGTDPAPTPAPAPSGKGSSAVSVALRYLGVPYVMGGTTPNGFDCSGFTQYVYAQLGIALPRTADAQLGSVRQVPRSQAQAGDLVFYVSGGSAYHVAMYLGNGKMIAARHSGTVISVQSVYGMPVFGRP